MMKQKFTTKNIKLLTKLSLSMVILLFSFGSSAQDYCTPTYTSGCSFGATIGDFSTSGGITNISNLNSGCASGSALGYTDYYDSASVGSLTALKGATISATFNNTTSWSGYAKIWIDLNQDGTFDDSELLVTSAPISSGTNYTATFSIPLSASTGDTRMRIRLREGSVTTFDACGSMSYGEAEDYKVSLVEPEPCLTANTPIVAGTVNAPESMCPGVSFVLNTQNTTNTFSGLTFQWQSSTSPTGPFVDVDGATSTFYNYTSGITTPTYFRLYVVCEGGSSDTTAPHLIGLNDFTDCYCTPVYSNGCSNGATIDGIQTTNAITDISNLNTGCSSSNALGYSDYTDSASLKLVARQEAPFQFKIDVTNYGGNAKVWIDYNKNGTFDADEVALSTPYISSGTSYTATINIPQTTDTGVTRMRVRVREGSTAITDPCGSVSYGEAEDYLIEVQRAKPCEEVVLPTTLFASLSPSSICSGGTAYLDLSEPLEGAIGFTYKWKSSPTQGGAYSYVSANSTPNTDLAVPNVTTSAYYILDVFCSGTLVRSTNPIYVEAVTPTAPIVPNAEICGPGQAVFSGSVASGNIFWYDSATATQPLYIGNDFTTPPLTEGRSYWVTGGAYPTSNDTVGSVSGNSSTYSAGPFNTGQQKNRLQLLYTASDLTSAGMTAGSISSMKFFVTSLPNFPLNEYNISYKQTTVGPPISMDVTGGFTNILNDATVFPTASGWYNFDFSSPILWDGTSNILFEICYSRNPDSSSYSGSHRYTSRSGQVIYSRTSSSEEVACDLTTTAYSSSYLPYVVFGKDGCETNKQEVQVIVRDTPVVSINPASGTYCLNDGKLTLTSTPTQPVATTLLWNTGQNMPQINITDPGLYWVRATNQYGCTTTDSAYYNLNPSPEFELGPDKVICEDGDAVLDATSSDAVSYFWSNGATSPSIVVEAAGSYIVSVTNSYGCVKSDTVNVTVNGLSPVISSILVNNLGPLTFNFSAYNPTNVIGYEWDFGDGSPVSYGSNPTHEYQAEGTYLVRCIVNSTCGTRVYKTFATAFTGIDDVKLADKNLLVYPNPAKNVLNIKTVGTIKISNIKVVNTLGQEVGNQPVDNKMAFTYDVSNLAPGVYYLYIESEAGVMVKKLTVKR